MKNCSYNLVKLLLSALDNSWRIDKHYMEDAGCSGCKKCKEILKRIKKDNDEHAEMLREELKDHCLQGK